MKYLLIVESPAKKKPIEKYLGKDYEVKASFGHIRDLPSKNGSVVPESNFEMRYEVSSKSTKHIEEIAKAAKHADIIYLATDPDREGEAIAWHVAEVLKEKKLIKSPDFLQRITFNEITKTAVQAAIKHPRAIDINLVNAQQARRALDYLVGFTLSPILWRKLPGCKSAGRVQSVALRLICEREDEIERFKTEEYWDITLGMLNSKSEAFNAKLTYIDGVKLEKFSIVSEEQAKELEARLQNKQFAVSSIEKKQQKRQPSPPFITSSLQQEAARKLGFSAKKTMQIAQKLYEGIDIGGEVQGLITYMRTDGVTLSAESVQSIRSLIEENFGDKYLPSSPRLYKSKAKNAQEAHEAIRPTNIRLNPQQLEGKLDKDQQRLYELIWKRTMACQMENVLIDMVAANLDSEDQAFSCRANGSTIAFDGFYRIYREGTDDTAEEEDKTLPVLKEGEKVKTNSIKPQQHFTEPLPRYTEASLVKKLEELGIGRPSTYAAILSVLQERKYVTLAKKRFIPEELGRLVTAFLVGFFLKYVQYDFTAELENELDEVAGGKLEWKNLLQGFWSGFNSNIASVSEYKIIDVISHLEQALDHHLFGEAGVINEKKKICPSCTNGKLSLKLGKFGAFLGCSNYPECNFRKQITSETSSAEEDTSQNTEGAQPENNKILGQNQNGEDVYLKKGPYGWYVQLGEQISKLEKPKRAPLPPGVLPKDLTLEAAIKFLQLPLNLGSHPSGTSEITIGIGKYGPYIKYENKFTSIPKQIDPFTVTSEQAAEIIETAKIKAKEKDPAQPKVGAKKKAKNT